MRQMAKSPDMNEMTSCHVIMTKAIPSKEFIQEFHFDK